MEAARIRTLVSLAVHIHKLTVIKVISARAFNSGNLEVLITAQIKANTPIPIRTESPNFLCQFSRRLHKMVMGRNASARSMDANQPIIIVSARWYERDNSNVLPVNREKSVCQ